MLHTSRPGVPIHRSVLFIRLPSRLFIRRLLWARLAVSSEVLNEEMESHKYRLFRSRSVSLSDSVHNHRNPSWHHLRQCVYDVSEDTRRQEVVMLKEFLALTLLSIPTDVGDTHSAVVLTEVSVETMKDCTEFTIQDTRWKKIEGSFHFAIILECKDTGVPL